jgi:hypothetical protein
MNREGNTPAATIMKAAEKIVGRGENLPLKGKGGMWRRRRERTGV